MAFITTRKKIVSSAIASSLAVMATPVIAQDEVSHLATIRAQAEQTESLKVDTSANKNMSRRYSISQNPLRSFHKNYYRTLVQLL